MRCTKCGCDTEALEQANAKLRERWHRFNLVTEKLEKVPQADYPTGDPATDMELMGQAYADKCKEVAKIKSENSVTWHEADILAAEMKERNQLRDELAQLRAELANLRFAGKCFADLKMVEMEAEKYDHGITNCRRIDAESKVEELERQLAAAEQVVECARHVEPMLGGSNDTRWQHLDIAIANLDALDASKGKP